MNIRERFCYHYGVANIGFTFGIFVTMWQKNGLAFPSNEYLMYSLLFIISITALGTMLEYEGIFPFKGLKQDEE